MRSPFRTNLAARGALHQRKSAPPPRNGQSQPSLISGWVALTLGRTCLSELLMWDPGPFVVSWPMARALTRRPFTYWSAAGLVAAEQSGADEHCRTRLYGRNDIGDPLPATQAVALGVGVLILYESATGESYALATGNG
jgi:hypothetical protein